MAFDSQKGIYFYSRTKLTKVLSKKLSPKVTSAALSKIVFLN